MGCQLDVLIELQLYCDLCQHWNLLIFLIVLLIALIFSACSSSSSSPVTPSSSRTSSSSVSRSVKSLLLLAVPSADVGYVDSKRERTTKLNCQSIQSDSKAWTYVWKREHKTLHADCQSCSQKPSIGCEARPPAQHVGRQGRWGAHETGGGRRGQWGWQATRIMPESTSIDD